MGEQDNAVIVVRQPTDGLTLLYAPKLGADNAGRAIFHLDIVARTDA